jgi:hypothetical protein
VSCDARADIRELFDDEGRLLPMSRSPDSIAVSVKAIHPGPFGTRIVRNDKLAARRMILEHIGKLKNPLRQAAGDLARILAGDVEDEDYDSGTRPHRGVTREAGALAPARGPHTGLHTARSLAVHSAYRIVQPYGADMANQSTIVSEHATVSCAP